jgi:hypothetical protein
MHLTTGDGLGRTHQLRSDAATRTDCLTCARAGQPKEPAHERIGRQPPGQEVLALAVSDPRSDPASGRRACKVMRCRHIYKRPLLRTGSSATSTAARPQPWPRAQSVAVTFASRGRRLTGKPVTESNLRLRAPAQIPADLLGRPGSDGVVPGGTELGVLRVQVSVQVWDCGQLVGLRVTSIAVIRLASTVRVMTVSTSSAPHRPRRR